MPRTVQLERCPAGFFASSVAPDGGAWIEVSGFHTSDEGAFFNRMLQACDVYLPPEPEIRRSEIDHMLAIIGPEHRATIFVNELNIVGRTQVKRGFQPGQPVMTDDVADIISVDVGVEIPSDHSVLFLFSWHWRKGMFFDFRQTATPAVKREYDVASIFAAAMCHLAFAERFSLTDSQWDYMIRAGWFPFIGLNTTTIDSLIQHCRDGSDFGQLQSRIVDECKALAPQFADSCRTNELFKGRSTAILTAAERFAEGDALSAAHLLYPQIEGVLRSYYAKRNADSPGQNRFLAEALRGAAAGRHSYSLLLSERFNTYLERVIFVPFDHTISSGVSRHTVAHGVVDLDQCDEKSVAIAFLSLHHLYFSLSGLQAAASQAG